MSSISLCFLRWEEERLVWDFQSHLWGLRADKEAALDARWRARPLPMAPGAALSLRVRVCYGCCSSQAISGGVNVNATDPERQWRISCVVNHVRSNARASHHGGGFLICPPHYFILGEPTQPLPPPSTHPPLSPNWANWVDWVIVLTHFDSLECISMFHKFIHLTYSL